MKAATINKNSVEKAKGKVIEAIHAYHWAVPSLNLEISKKLLEYNEDMRKTQVLKTIFSGELYETHEEMNEKRVKNTGNWFTETEEFKSWIDLDGNISLLTCTGKRA